MKKTIQINKIKDNPFVDEKAEHNKFLNRWVRKYLNEEGLSEEQKDVLKNYYRHLIVESKCLSLNSQINRIQPMSAFGVSIKKSFNEVTKQDIIDFIFSLKASGLTDGTINNYKIKFRVFYKWLYQTKDYPKLVADLKPVTVDYSRNEDDLLLPQDIKELCIAATNKRDKLLPILLWDTAARRSELLNCKIKNVVFDEYGAKINVEGKTGKRSIRLLDSLPYLHQWLEVHPYKDEPEAPLIVNLGHRDYGRQMKATSLPLLLSKLAKIRGVSKSINPHSFRHARLTWLVKEENFNEKDLKLFAGWGKNSPMPDTYMHYGIEEVDKKLLKNNGLLKDEKGKKKIEELKPRKCLRCERINTADTLYCSCGMALDLKTVTKDIERREQADQQMNELFADNEFKELLKGYLKKKAQERK